ncbi:2-succinyl-6-hydroxy-2,4-cyclohexadiene-1-carboxylate synthase [Streptomyces microflavus]
MTTTVSFTVDSAHGPRPVSVNYERTGAGAPLVLLHGIGHHHQAWDPVTRILAAEREVIALDLPGFGTSPALPDGVPYTLEAVTPVLGAFFAALGLDRPHVVGNSLGGLFALELGRRELVRSVTALSPAGFWNEPERRYAFTTLRAMRRAALALPVPAIERLSRSAAGRTALTSTIYARPGRRSPRPSSPRPWPSGVAQATTLLGFVLREQGLASVGVEDPGSPEHASLFAATGLGATSLPLDAEGLALGPLRRSGVRAVVTTPAHQFPTGIAYPAERRRKLLDWAREADAVIMEDDYDGDFRYDRAPVGALQGLDPERVVYTGSVSKSLAPGLRLGWLIAPVSLTGRIVARKRTMDLGNPAIDQAVLADFISRGAYDRQLRRCQRAYRERRDAMVAALDEHFPGTEVSGIAAGLHIIARLPERYGPEGVFLGRAAGAGIALRPLSDCGDAGPEDGSVALALGYAHLGVGDIARGVASLAAAQGLGSGA